MIRRITSILACCVALSLRAEEATGAQLHADTTIADDKNQEVILKGNAELREADLLVTADEMRYKTAQNAQSDTITASGHVVYTRGAVRILADRVVVHRLERTFEAEHIRLGQYPYYIEGRTAHGSRDEITVNDARVSYGEPGPWQPTATAARVTVSPGRRIQSDQAMLGIGNMRPLPFPKFDERFSEPMLALLTLTGGYRGSLGAYIDAGVHFPVSSGVRLGGDVGYYTARGVLAGPSGTYVDPSDPEKLNGLFRSGYINDHGDKKTDVLGRPVPENRAFIEWRHQQQITDDLTLTGQLNWWKDSEIVRDFRPREFFPVQQPDTFLEANYTQANTFVSVFARFEPNSFEVVQQRLPEIRFDLLPTAIGGGIYERFDASIAVLRENPLAATPIGFQTVTPTGAFPSGILIPINRLDAMTYAGGAAHELQSTRLDAYYSLMRPIAPNNWLTFTPVVGGRVTDYEDTRGAAKSGSYTRALGEVGADAEMRTSGTFNYKNEAWHIDGLRHLFTPKISYRYIPEADRGAAYIPPIDRQVFSTYLQPLGLGEARNIDDLHATNTLRLALDNTLQTRDPQYGARDLLRLNVADDFRFKRQPGERDVSEIQTELAAMPTRWLEFGLYNSFAPQTFTLRELNSGITLHDGDAWTFRFSNNFLRHNLQEYAIDGQFRINEEFRGLTVLRYDQRTHRFTEQSYGIVQNLANTWRISYVVSLYSGRRRESGFGFSVQIDTIRF